MKLLLSFFIVLLLAPAIYSQTRDLRIIEQPRPALPQDYGQLDAQGSVLLKVEFLATGKIGRIVVILKFTQELTDLAVEVAKQIKFDPKRVDGKAVDSFKTVEYYYSWHGKWRVASVKKTAQ